MISDAVTIISLQNELARGLERSAGRLGLMRRQPNASQSASGVLRLPERLVRISKPRGETPRLLFLRQFDARPMDFEQPGLPDWAS